ncbi:gamma-glutamylcyclotransferase [Devosia sp.]|uniref:gamma-glutamylcyclotransferase n=1 Tax=Devosia sp. TaxID=1871048 RepID=UPI003A914925
MSAGTPETSDRGVPVEAFAHHPELRDRIVDPLSSFFRTFDIAALAEAHPELDISWISTDADREAARARALAAHGGGDLWVFAYGSLMWDPAFRFTDVRRAVVPGYARRFILLDTNGGRGTKAAPGLMAALDTGDRCEGLAFRIAEQDIETETEILWRREMVGPAYLPTFVAAELDDGVQTALTFVADHDAENIASDLTRTEQIQLLAHGAGMLGTSKAYLENIISQFAQLGIVDADCSGLLEEVEAYLAAQNGAA